ncbi:MAG: hypothetical protein U0175_36390 [Caldilineaceae bacterium]
MIELGYALSSEEHTPNDLIRQAQRAEEIGFTFALISDHYHPWVSTQGHSPFVWSVIGGLPRKPNDCGSALVSPARSSASIRRFWRKPRPR